MGSVLVWKAIKPARLRDDKMRLALLNAMGKVATQIKKDYAKTTKTWEEKPEFETVESLSGKPPGPTVLVGTDDVVYRYVDEGTKPHMIFAGAYTGKSNATVLAFNSWHKPKTQPRILESFKGGTGGDPVRVPFVQHPGTQAREFTQMIQEKWEGKFKDAMEDAMVRAAHDSGHGA